MAKGMWLEGAPGKGNGARGQEGAEARNSWRVAVPPPRLQIYEQSGAVSQPLAVERVFEVVVVEERLNVGVCGG